LKMDQVIQKYLNQKYSSSKIELEGGGMTMYSSEQVSAGIGDLPLNVIAGLRLMHWFDRSGIEASLKTKVISVNSVADQISPIQAEARYLYRWRLPWNLFSKLGSSQFALVTGYEYYRNNANGQYSPGYDILKAGFSISFPLLGRWDTGGEALVGTGLDQSQKLEMSGNLNYYVQRDWSFGVGYRVHLFGAGSDSTTPYGVPYREGYGEAFSVLRRHY